MIEKKKLITLNNAVCYNDYSICSTNKGKKYVKKKKNHYGLNRYPNLQFIAGSVDNQSALILIYNYTFTPINTNNNI